MRRRGVVDVTLTLTKDDVDTVAVRWHGRWGSPALSRAMTRATTIPVTPFPVKRPRR